MKQHPNGLIEIESSKELETLAEQARAQYQSYLKEAREKMTPERAQFIRQLRIEYGYTWRKIAHDARERFNGTWLPLSNQLAGMALCEAAAETFGENAGDEKWNGPLL